MDQVAARTVVPEAGSWNTTWEPPCPGTIATSTSRPRLLSLATASSRPMPTTFGIGNSGGPFETTIVTVPPGCRSVPFGGVCEISVPSSTLSENSSRTSTTKP